jgi:hypothetical protein
LTYNVEFEENCQKILRIVNDCDALDHATDVANALPDFERRVMLLEKLGKKEKNSHIFKSNRLPSPVEMKISINEAIAKFILSNDVHKSDVNITKTDKIVTAGSCFARNLGYYLRKAGYDIARFPLAEELNSTFANKLMLRWLCEETIDEHNTETLEQLFLNAKLSKLKIKNYFEQADHFVFTLGTTQCFFDDDNQYKISPPGVGNFRTFLKSYTPRMTSASENEAEISAQIGMIRSLNPNASICFTLSPVPLNVSFCGGDAITRDCISKSTLRIAIENVLQNRDCQGVRYFPSFEIVRWLAPMYMKPIGQDDGSMSHVTDQLVENIVQSFVQHHA